MIALEEKLGKVGEAILDWMTTDWAIGETKDDNQLHNLRREIQGWCIDKYGNELDNWKIGETKVSSN